MKCAPGMACHNMVHGHMVHGTWVVHGTSDLGCCAPPPPPLQVSYGANIAKFPAGGHLFKGALNDVSGGANTPGTWAAFGFAQVRMAASAAHTLRAVAVAGPVDHNAWCDTQPERLR